jgi:hypothetical protein
MTDCQVFNPGPARGKFENKLYLSNLALSRRSDDVWPFADQGHNF